MLKQFAAYLVARCFMKMCRRVSHWFSQGFIYYLGQVEAEKLQNAVAQMDVGYTTWAGVISTCVKMWPGLRT